MERPTMRHTSGRGWRVTTPSFPDCAAADDFYAEAHRLIEAQFCERRGQGGRGMCVADFFAREIGGDTVVTLRLRLRENGHNVAEKTLVHRWRDGQIAPKRTYPRLRAFLRYIISKIALPHKRENESGDQN